MREKKEKIEQNQWTQLVARLLHNVNTHGYTSRKEKMMGKKEKVKSKTKGHICTESQLVAIFVCHIIINKTTR